MKEGKIKRLMEPNEKQRERGKEITQMKTSRGRERERVHRVQRWRTLVLRGHKAA